MKSEKDREIREVMKQDKQRGRRSRPKNTLKEREERLAFILDYGTEEDYIGLLKNWDIPVSQNLSTSFGGAGKRSADSSDDAPLPSFCLPSFRGTHLGGLRFNDSGKPSYQIGIFSL